jgi:hypothetical protein
MTRAFNEKDFPGLHVIAGGREQWHHNPDMCEINFVKAKRGALSIKCSAGGFDRGISIEVSLSLEFIVQHFPDLFASHNEEISLSDREKLEVLEDNLNLCSAQWLQVTIDNLPLRSDQKQVLRDNGIETVQELCAKTQGDLKSLPKIGDSAILNIKQWMIVRNLRWEDTK